MGAPHGFRLAQQNADGTFEPWLGAIDGGNDDNAYHGVLLPDGQLLVAGYTTSALQGTTPSDLLLAAFRTATIGRTGARVQTLRIR